MDDDEVQKAHIKGQLQGLRAALRAQPNGIVAPGAPAIAAAVPPATAPRLAAPSRNGVLAAPPPVPPSHTPAPAARPFQPPPPSAQAFQLSPPAPPAAPSGRRETVSAAAPAASQPPPRARAASPRVSRPAAPVAAAPAPRAVSPAPRSLSPAPSRPNAGAVGAGGGGGGGTPVKPSAGRKGGGKSDCVAKVEEMQKQREERRRRAEEAKLRREEDTKAAEGQGGIEAVDFLRKIHAYREAHGLGEALPWEGGNVWEDEAAGGAPSSIRVCVRKRPMLKPEVTRHDFDVVSADNDHSTLIVHEPKTKVDLTKEVGNHRFTFDAFFNEEDGNDRIYAATLAPLLDHVFSGGHATVFAFGQTGSGKTCTMAGHGLRDATDGNTHGLYKLAAHDLVSRVAHHGTLVLGVSFFEVYRGLVLDLLGERARLEVLEDGKGRVQIVGLREEPIYHVDDLLHLVRQAEELRAVGATSANETSSRSHAILQVTPLIASDCL